ncbi:LuxR family transcriptional regulator [Betaproteobacteria bacterium PRO7]|nr:LuxR family transcriptional regulator [Betaproteobacteria bacterium PRO7]
MISQRYRSRWLGGGMRANGNRAVRFKHALNGRDGEVTYELICRATGFVCRRITSLRGGGQVSLTLPVDTLGTLRLLLDADDEASAHRHALREMLLQAAFAGIPEDDRARNESARPTADSARGASDPALDDELGVHAYLKALAASIGMDGYIAFAGDLAHRLGPYLHLLVGCTPGWVPRYLQQRWYMNDPLLKQSVDSGRPIMGSEIERHDDIARGIAKNSARHAIFAAACFPSAVNAPGIHARFGCVVLVSSLNAARVEPLIKDRSVFARGAVSTAVDAWVDALKRDAVYGARLSARELAVLTQWREGDTAVQSALALGVAESGVNYHRRSIKMKLGAANLRDAYAIAADLGLLRS